MAEAARREVMEETGLEVEVGEMLATVDLIERDRRPGPLSLYPDRLQRRGASAALRRAAMPPTPLVQLAEIEPLGLWSETVRIIELAGERRSCR